MSDYTPTPWFAEAASVHGPEDWPVPLLIATCSLTHTTGQDNANAEMIARAVNSHADLLAALKAMRRNVDVSRINNSKKSTAQWTKLVLVAEAAIAKAEGTTP